MCVNLYILFNLFLLSLADEHTHKYEDGEEVVLWMNTIGPYHNRQETYRYFSLPFCRGPKRNINHYHETIGEALQGVELEFSGLDIDFKTDVKRTKYCDVSLTTDKYNMFIYAIKNLYWYQMYLDDLPIWGLLGDHSKNGDYLMYTNKKLKIAYNNKRIVEVTLENGNAVKLKPDMTIQFTYEVSFKASNTKYSERFDKYLDSNFFQHNIHWFSIFNSFMMVIFLVGLVSMILIRTLNKDYARYTKDEELEILEKDLGDEYGWKQVHGDVFRAPSSLIIFTSFIGNGTHIIVVTVIVILLTLLGHLYNERGSILSVIIFVYAITSPINGFCGGSYYLKSNGRFWIKQLIVGALMLPVIVCGTAFLINFIAIYYQASRAIPFLTMLSIFSIVIFVILPLNLIGAVIGRNASGKANYPCRINSVPRPIPGKKMFMEPIYMSFIAGILPFGSIFIEMYFIFTSFWAYKVYYVFGFTFLVVIIMLIVTSCVSIVCTYVLLNSEDYRWQWTSMCSGASTALYVYIYSFYYFLFKTKMYGLFQTAFFFGYMALFCFGLGLMCGSIGFLSSSIFVRKIYSYVKID